MTRTYAQRARFLLGYGTSKRSMKGKCMHGFFYKGGLEEKARLFLEMHPPFGEDGEYCWKTSYDTFLWIRRVLNECGVWVAFLDDDLLQTEYGICMYTQYVGVIGLSPYTVEAEAPLILLTLYFLLSAGKECAYDTLDVLQKMHPEEYKLAREILAPKEIFTVLWHEDPKSLSSLRKEFRLGTRLILRLAREYGLLLSTEKTEPSTCRHYPKFDPELYRHLDADCAKEILDCEEMGEILGMRWDKIYQEIQDARLN